MNYSKNTHYIKKSSFLVCNYVAEVKCSFNDYTKNTSFSPTLLLSVSLSNIYRKCSSGLCGPLSYWTYCPFYLHLLRFNYVFLGFSDLASVAGILPFVLQTPPPFIFGRSKSISNTFVEVVLIDPVIIIHAALCGCPSSDLAKAISNLSRLATAAYMILLYPFNLCT